MRALVSVLFCLLPLSQQQQPPPSEPAAPPAGLGSGVIKGRVVGADNSGPLPYVAVSLSMPPPNRLLRFALTDRGGRFEFTNVPSGPFILRAQPPSYFRRYGATSYGSADPLKPSEPSQIAPNQTIDRIEISLPVTGAIAGRVIDEDGIPVTGARVGASKLNERTGEFSDVAGVSTDDLGIFRLYGLTAGVFVVQARVDATGSTYGGTAYGDAMNAPGFAPTYYPAAPSKMTAEQIRLTPGRDITGLEIRLARARIFDIAGVVVDSRGRSVPKFRLMFFDPSSSSSRSTSVDASGRFRVRGLLPGEYRLGVEPNEAVRDETVPREFGSAVVRITGADVEDLVITTRPGIDVAGRLAFEQERPAILPTLSVSFTAVDWRGESSMFHDARVQPDLSFTLHDLVGPAVIRPPEVPGWWLKTVTLGTEDITDRPMEFQARDSGRLQIVFTSRAASIDGTATDEKGQIVRDSIVVLCASDPAAWVPRSSRTRLTDVGPDGRFRLTGLRSGKYLIVAVRGAPVSTIYSNPRTALEALSKHATEISVGDEEQRSIDLKVVTLDALR